MWEQTERLRYALDIAHCRECLRPVLLSVGLLESPRAVVVTALGDVGALSCFDLIRLLSHSLPRGVEARRLRGVMLIARAGGEQMSNESLQVIAQITKYLGVVVGTASSVWGAIHELNKSGPDGQKRLTTAGKFSIAITIVSFVVSLASAAVGDRLARIADNDAQKRRQDDAIAQITRHQELISGELQALDAADKTRSEQRRQFDELAQREAKSTRNIVFSAQPLRSLNVDWVFPALTPSTSQQIVEAENKLKKPAEFLLYRLFDGRSTPEYFQQYFDMRQDALLTPVLNSLGGAGWSDDSTVALFALDDSAAVVLPLGYVTLEQLGFKEDAAGSPAGSPKPISVAAGVRFHEKFENGNDVTPRLRSFVSPFSAADVHMKGHSLTISWDLPSTDCMRAIDKADPSIVVTARMPDRMRVMILTHIYESPWETGESTNMNVPLPWQEAKTTDITPTTFRGSRLRITANDVREMSATYTMKLVSITQLYDGEIYYGDGALWRGEREAAPAGR